MGRDILVYLSDGWREAPLAAWDDSGEAVLHPADRAALDWAADLAREGGGSVTAVALGGDEIDQMLEAARALGAARALRVACADVAALSPWQAVERLHAAVPALAGFGWVLCGERRAWEGDFVGPALEALFAGREERPELLYCKPANERRVPECGRMEALFAAPRVEVVECGDAPVMPLLRVVGTLPLPARRCRMLEGGPERATAGLAHALRVRLEAPGRELPVPERGLETQALGDREIFVFFEKEHGLPRSSSLALEGLARNFAGAHGGSVRLIDVEESTRLDAENLPAAVFFPATATGIVQAHALAARLRLPLAVGCQGFFLDEASGRVEALRIHGKKIERIASLAPALLATVLPPADPELVPYPLPKTASARGVSAVAAFGRGCPAALLPEVEALAHTLGADCIATRGAADMGLAPLDRIRVYSSFREKSDVYLGLGVSGVFQHLDAAGGTLCRMAVNLDPAAPIFQHAEYGIAGDVETCVPLLLKQLG